MAYYFSEIIPSTFVDVQIGNGDNYITIVERYNTPDRLNNLKNIHITDCSVEYYSRTIIKYTLTIQYHPNTFNVGDANRFERLITNLSATAKDANKLDNSIRIKFGYSAGSPYPRSVSSTSDIFTGSIINLSSNLNQNYIEYTLTAIGKHLVTTQTRLKDSATLSITDPITTWLKQLWIDNKLESADIQQSGSKDNQLDSDYMLKHFRFESDVELPSLWELSGWAGVYKTINSNLSSEAVADMSSLLSFDTIKKSPENMGQRSMQFSANFDLMTFLEALIKKVNTLCNSKNIKRCKSAEKWYKHQFAITADSFLTSNNNQQIYGRLHLVDVSESKNKEKFSYIFNYGNIQKGDTFLDHLVISWNCNYDATATIHSGKLFDSISFGQQIDTNGNISNTVKNTTLTGSSTSTSTNIIDSTQESLENTAAIDKIGAYPYEATLTVLGNPSSVSLCRKVIEVRPMINGNKHHTAGSYLIVGVKHNIGSNMLFTTTYQLVRLNNNSAKQFKEQSSSEDIAENTINNDVLKKYYGYAIRTQYVGGSQRS